MLPIYGLWICIYHDSVSNWDLYCEIQRTRDEIVLENLYFDPKQSWENQIGSADGTGFCFYQFCYIKSENMVRNHLKLTVKQNQCMVRKTYKFKGLNQLDSL